MSERNIGPLKVLPPEQLKVINGAEEVEKRKLFVAGYADFDLKQLILFRGNGTSVIAPFSIFKPSGTGLAPDFTNLEIIDWGQTVKLGEYEASTTGILYDLDPAFKAEANGNKLFN
jgi:hypothetical protein